MDSNIPNDYELYLKANVLAQPHLPTLASFPSPPHSFLVCTAQLNKQLGHSLWLPQTPGWGDTREAPLLLYKERIHQNREVAMVLISVSFSCISFNFYHRKIRKRQNLKQNKTWKGFANIGQDHFEIGFSIEIITLLQSAIHLNKQELCVWFRGCVETVKESLKVPRLNVIRL